MTAVNSSAPFFAFEGEVRAIPASPTHCGCGVELEPLRRYAGKCKQCVVFGAPAVRPVATFRLQRIYYRRTRTRQRERYVEVHCSCGAVRHLKWANWEHYRPACCNRCRLRSIEARGFEPEFAK